MSLLMLIADILIIIALVMTLLKNPNQKNKTLIYVLLALIVIFTILNIFW